MEAREKRIAEINNYERNVLIVFGEDDPYLNIEVAKQFHTEVPNSELSLVPNAGHYVQLDQARSMS